MTGLPSYRACYDAQLGAIGWQGQRRLRQSTVLVAGAGGLGTSISSILATTGVGRLIVVDPQRLDVTDFNRYSFARRADLGLPKVDVLGAFLKNRPHIDLTLICGQAESAQVRTLARDASFLVSASNTVESRLAMSQLAVKYRVPHVSAAVSDARERRSGFVIAWTPEHTELACPACFLNPAAHVSRSESLLTSILATVAALAAGLVVDIISRPPKRGLVTGNCVSIDIDSMTMEPLRVFNRPGCPACGGTGARRPPVRGQRE